MRRKTHRRLNASAPAAVQREHIEQRYFFALLETQVRRHPELAFFHSIPNGARVGKIQALKLSREGLLAGVCDVFGPVSRGGFSGIYLEFKSPRDPITGKARGYPSREQRKFLAHAVSEGYFCAIVDDRKIAFDLALAYVRGEIKRTERPHAVEQHRRA